jgi:hypothetical protein
MKNRISGSTFVRGFLCSSKVDLNADFFVSIIRNQELGCLLRGGVAGCIAGFPLRDAKSFKDLPDLRMIIDRWINFPFKSLRIPLSFPGELGRKPKTTGIEWKGCFRLEKRHE